MQNIKSKIFFALAVLAVVLVTAYTSNFDHNTWWHLSSGRELSVGMSIPQYDNFSYAGPTAWKTRGWLFDAFIYSTSTYLKIEMLFLVKIFMLAAFFYIIVLTVFKRLKGKYMTVVFPVLAMAYFLLQPAFTLSPHMFSFLFAAFFIYALEHEPSKRHMGLYLSMPLAALVWANMDNSAVLGIVLMLIYLVYHFDSTTEIREKNTDISYPIFLGALVATSMVVLVNPEGYRAIILFFSENLKPSALHKSINDPVVFGMSDVVFTGVFYSYAILMLLAIWYNLRGADIGRKAELFKDILLIAVPFFAAVFYKEFMPYFIILTVGVFCYYLQLIFKWDMVWEKKWTEAQVSGISRTILLLLSPLLFLYAGLEYINAKPVAYPNGAVKYIMRIKPDANIFAPANWNGFLEDQLYPRYKTMLTGRNNIENKTAKDYLKIINADPEALKTCEEYNINTFILPPDCALARVLQNSPKFKPAYFDGTDIIFVNKEKTEQYLTAYNIFDGKNPYPLGTKAAYEELNEFAQNYPSETAYLALGTVYAKINAPEAIEFLRDIVMRYPEYTGLYDFIGKLYYEQKDYKTAINMWKKNPKKKHILAH